MPRIAIRSMRHYSDPTFDVSMATYFLDIFYYHLSKPLIEHSIEALTFRLVTSPLLCFCWVCRINGIARQEADMSKATKKSNTDNTDNTDTTTDSPDNTDNQDTTDMADTDTTDTTDDTTNTDVTAEFVQRMRTVDTLPGVTVRRLILSTVANDTAVKRTALEAELNVALANRAKQAIVVSKASKANRAGAMSNHTALSAIVDAKVALLSKLSKSTTHGNMSIIHTQNAKGVAGTSTTDSPFFVTSGSTTYLTLIDKQGVFLAALSPEASYRLNTSQCAVLIGSRDSVGLAATWNAKGDYLPNKLMRGMSVVTDALKARGVLATEAGDETTIAKAAVLSAYKKAISDNAELLDALPTAHHAIIKASWLTMANAQTGSTFTLDELTDTPDDGVALDDTMAEYDGMNL